MKMNYYADKWNLDVSMCPSDAHFNEWIDHKKLRNKTIFHFGSGNHHLVGTRQAARRNRTLCITASREEYDTYIDLAINNVAVARSYRCYFGDIYLSDPALLPEFDVVSLFHLCEYSRPNTASREYGGITDAKLLGLFTARLKPMGYILFYTRSEAWRQAQPIVARWEKKASVEQAGLFKSLLVYRKIGSRNRSLSPLLSEKGVRRR